MIKSKKELGRKKIEIDLTGPQGNVFYLMGIAKQLSSALGKDYEEIRGRMVSGDYENAVEVFDEEFGGFVNLYR